MRKLLTTLVALPVLAFSLTSQAFADEGKTDAVKTKDGYTLDSDQIYRSLLGTTPTTLDPTFAQYTEDFLILRDLFETLVRQLPTDGSLGPAAAESWTVSPDGTVYTFKLQPKATWNDGKPVTAKDFVYSWRRLVDPKTSAGYGAYLAQLNVVNAGKIAKGEVAPDQLGVRAVDDYTFEVTLTQPTPWFLQGLLLQVTAPLREDVITKWGTQWVQPEHFVTNGPYQVTEYKPRTLLRTALRKDYWDAANIIMQGGYFDIAESTDPNRNYFAYLTNEIDTTGVPAQFKDKVKQSRPEELLEFVKKDYDFVRINNKRFTDKEVRRALTLLWDSKFLNEVVFKAGLYTGLLVPNNASEGDYVKSPEWSNWDVEKRTAEAVKILTAKGYSKDNPLKLKLLTAGKPNRYTIGMRERFNKLANGYAVLEFDIVGDYQTRLGRIDVGDYDLATSGWVPDYDHIQNSLSIFVCDDPNNKAFFCDHEFDRLVSEAGKELDVEKRKQAYAKATAYLSDQFPAIPFSQTKSFILKSPRLQGYNVNNDYRYIRDYYHTTLRVKPE